MLGQTKGQTVYYFGATEDTFSRKLVITQVLSGTVNYDIQGEKLEKCTEQWNMATQEKFSLGQHGYCATYASEAEASAARAKLINAKKTWPNFQLITVDSWSYNSPASKSTSPANTSSTTNTGKGTPSKSAKKGR
jgi:hypothetical protein